MGLFQREWAERAAGRECGVATKIKLLFLHSFACAIIEKYAGDSSVKPEKNNKNKMKITEK